MNMKKIYSAMAVPLLSFGISGGAQAISYDLLHLTEGSQSRATSNLSHYVANHADTTRTTMDNATFNAMSVADLAAAYDVIVAPWYVNNTANLDWATRLLPYMQAGGGILWEDPNNLGDLTGSGITFGSTAGYINSGLTLVAPFDENSAESWYHVHYGITAITSDWDIFSTDANGSIHGVYGEFGSNGGRMVLGVSDNLYHPDMTTAAAAGPYNLLINELAWIGTGDVSGDPTDPPCTVDCGEDLPEPGTLVLLGLGLFGLVSRKKMSIRS